MQLIVESQSELANVASKIIEFSEDRQLWIFYGEMGSGKTTLIKSIAQELQVEDIVHSPSFNLVNEYKNQHGKCLYHFDFYRIKNETEAMDIGVEEYFDSGDLCLVEWPEKIPSLLPEKYLRIEIELTSHTGRRINISHYGG
ncbi:MAG: tRNA (adenosine(37)-N6)-threonylcarbamoyltransferase complex ATPase subunit type 1 TsaE [Cytophagales bacterium]|nr:tRNA (adenosine(37)-N6)-threonylcarbamoyltransferase complex ATPase subunit type 1 TsaE [Cytophagales bacterium]